MASRDPGKAFEDNFEDSETTALVQRFYDVTTGFKGVSYCCDYLVFANKRLYWLELKSTKTGTLPLRNMSDNQYDGLQDKDTYADTICGLVIKYTNYKDHYFIPIAEVKRIKESGAASIRHKQIIDGKIKCVKMDRTDNKPVNWEYDIDKLLLDLKNMEA